MFVVEYTFSRITKYLSDIYLVSITINISNVQKMQDHASRLLVRDNWVKA